MQPAASRAQVRPEAAHSAVHRPTTQLHPTRPVQKRLVPGTGVRLVGAR